MKTIDINCDVGEGFHNEALLMPYLSSCNIACGAHAGSTEIIEKTILLAQENHVKIGAHPSFPDRENFGRKVLDISLENLQKSIGNQLLLFRNISEKLGVKVHHVKAHGALYNLIAKDRDTATVFVKAIQTIFDSVFLYVPSNSEIEKVALQNNLKIKYEAFIDRNYNDNGTLVARTQKEALIENPKQAYKHVLNMLLKGKVKTITGIEKQIKADTFCVHGDGENALGILKFLKKSFLEKGIEVI